MGPSTRTGHPRLTTRSLELLLELLDQPVPALSGSALSDFLLAEAVPLIEAGLLKPSGHTPTATGVEGEDKPVALVWNEGRYGYFDASGWVVADQGRLTRHVVDIDALCRTLLSDAAGAPTTELLPDLLWDLGTVRLPHRKRRVALVLVRRVFDRASWLAIRKRLVERPQESRVMIIASARRDVPDDVPVGNRAAVLGDVVENGCLGLNLQALAAILGGRAIAVSNEPVVVVGDGREVRLYGEVFRFPRGDQQRRIVVAIHERHRAGELMSSWADVASHLDLPADARFRDYFKNCKPPVLGRLLKEEHGMVGFCLHS